MLGLASSASFMQGPSLELLYPYNSQLTTFGAFFIKKIHSYLSAGVAALSPAHCTHYLELVERLSSLVS